MSAPPRESPNTVATLAPPAADRPAQRTTMRKVITWGAQLLLAVAAAAFLLFGISSPRERLPPASAAPPPSAEPRSGGPRLTGPDTVRLEGDVVQSLGVRTAPVR